MEYLILTILSLLLDVVVFYLYLKKEKKHKEIENEIEQKNQNIKQENQRLLQEQQDIQNQLKTLKELKDNTKEIAKQAYSEYCELLDQQYGQKEEEYNTLKKQLYSSYEKMQDELQDEYQKKREEYDAAAAEIYSDLDKIKNTRAAAVQAQLKEEEIKKQKAFYSLAIPLEDINDAKILREIEYKLNNPRVLRMLIWSSFYQKPMTQLCNNVVGTKIKTGIYKITNQLTGICYIGQANDISERWKKHAKCGLGIDTPVNNKLYQAMIKDGLENFTFEILEECPKEELNEKEKFYIELYQAKEYRL